MDPYYPCVKYKDLADPKIDGTDYFIVAESMHLTEMDLKSTLFDCSLSFTCKKDQKAFYKLIKDCLQFQIHGEIFKAIHKQSWFSLILKQTIYFQ